MNDVDDTLLMSYVDGELDPQTAREVEASLFRDPVRLARMRELRENSALVRAAFQHALYGGPAIAPPSPDPAIRRRRGFRAPAPVTVAATIAALAIGLAAGLVVDRHDGVPEVGAARATALQRSLETRPSGDALPWRDGGSGETGRITPVSTYRTDSGRYCREFEEERVTATGAVEREAGVACRQAGGRWRVRIRYFP